MRPGVSIATILICVAVQLNVRIKLSMFATPIRRHYAEASIVGPTIVVPKGSVAEECKGESQDGPNEKEDGGCHVKGHALAHVPPSLVAHPGVIPPIHTAHLFHMASVTR